MCRPFPPPRITALYHIIHKLMPLLPVVEIADFEELASEFELGTPPRKLGFLQ